MRADLKECVREATEGNEPEWMDVYRGICNAKGPPKEGFFKITIPRRQRRTHRRQYLAARIWRPLPLDPEIGEILDRYPNLVGEIEGREADYREVWARGESIEESEYNRLRAFNALIL